MTSTVASLHVARSDALLAVMRAGGSVGPDARVTGIHQLEGGWSRHSFAVTVDDGEGRGLELVVRCKPQGAILDTDLAQEFRTYALLGGEPVPTPAVYGMDESTDTPFGGPFFVMSRLIGGDLNVWRRRDRATLEADWNGGRTIAEDLVCYLAAIHTVPAERVQGEVVARDFRETLRFWHGVQREMQLVRDPIVEEAYEWALDHEPDPVVPALVHGDYRIGNCLVADDRITGVLDWELSFFGDPRFDLGYMSLDYHAGKFVKPGSSLLNGVAQHEWFWERYAAATGRSVDPAVVNAFAVVGALMLIAILTTGVRIYAEGKTQDIRMAWSRFAIPGLRQDLARLMGWGEGAAEA